MKIINKIKGNCFYEPFVTPFLSLFDNDTSKIVTKRGQEILDTYSREELDKLIKENIDKL